MAHSEDDAINQRMDARIETDSQSIPEDAPPIGKKAGHHPHIEWELPNEADLTGVDLRGILTNLRWSTGRGRDRAASGVATRSYRHTGLRLMSTAVSAEPDAPDDDPVSHPFVARLSRPRVVTEMGNETHPSLSFIGSANRLRGRWAAHRNYVADLLLVALTGDNWNASVNSGARQHLLKALWCWNPAPSAWSAFR